MTIPAIDLVFIIFLPSGQFLDQSPLSGAENHSETELSLLAGKSDRVIRQVRSSESMPGSLKLPFFPTQPASCGWKLRHLLYGAKRVMDGDGVAAAITEDSDNFLMRLVVDSTIDPIALEPNYMENRIQALAQVLLAVLGDAQLQEREKNPIIGRMVRRLRTFRALQWPEAKDG
jgi:hypothetical protein